VLIPHVEQLQEGLPHGLGSQSSLEKFHCCLTIITNCDKEV
jgi:hypothetical protein